MVVCLLTIKNTIPLDLIVAIANGLEVPELL